MTYWDTGRITKVTNSYFPVYFKLIEAAYNYYYRGNLSYFSKTEMSKTLRTSYSYINRIFPLAIQAEYIASVSITGTKYKQYIFNKDKKEEVEVLIRIMKESKESYLKIMEEEANGGWEAKTYPINLVREHGIESLRSRGV